MVEITVTGFEPFGAYKVNTSQIVLNKLNKNIRKIILPVNYDKVTRIISNILDNNPDILLMLGLAPFSPSVKLETIALNIAHSNIPDNDGIRKIHSVIIRESPLALKTNTNILHVHKKLLENKIPNIVSYYAGTYLCNYSYYIALSKIYTGKLKTKVLFVHLPHASEIILDNPNKPSLPLYILVKAVNITINILKNSYIDSNFST